MTTKKSIIKNYIYSVAYQVMSIIIPLITTPYLSRILGAEKIGIYSYTVSIVTYFILFGSLGTFMYGSREIAYVQNDKHKRSKLFWEIFLLRVVTVALAAAVFFFTFVAFGEYQIYFSILSLHLIATIFDVSWLFEGMENFKTTATRNIVIRLAGTAAIFAFVKSADDLWIYLLIFSLSSLLSNISLWISLPKHVEFVKLKSLNLRKHFKPIAALFLPQIASQIYVVLDKVMIGAIISDKSELGFYEQGEKVIKLLITVITAISSVMLPRIANYFANNNKEELEKHIHKSFKFIYLLAIPMIFGILAVTDLFVPAFFGEGYDKVVTIMNMLSPIILIIGFGSVIGIQYLVPTKRQTELAISYCVGAAVNVILNLALIQSLGAIGASIGTIFAELFVTGTQLYFVRGDFSLKTILKFSAKYLISGLVMFAVCLFVKSKLPANVTSLLIIVGSGALTYLLCLIISREDLTKDVFRAVGKKLHLIHEK